MTGTDVILMILAFVISGCLGVKCEQHCKLYVFINISYVYNCYLFQKFSKEVLFFKFIYLSRGIQFSRASLNGALTKHKNKDIESLKLNNQLS